jgi:hypothetical protein
MRAKVDEVKHIAFMIFFFVGKRFQFEKVRAKTQAKLPRLAPNNFLLAFRVR